MANSKKPHIVRFGSGIEIRVDPEERDRFWNESIMAQEMRDNDRLEDKDEEIVWVYAAQEVVGQIIRNDDRFVSSGDITGSYEAVYEADQ